MLERHPQQTAEAWKAFRSTASKCFKLKTLQETVVTWGYAWREAPEEGIEKVFVYCGVEGVEPQLSQTPFEEVPIEVTEEVPVTTRETLHPDVGTRVRKVRKQLGLSEKHFSELMGFPSDFYQQLLEANLVQLSREDFYLWKRVESAGTRLKSRVREAKTFSDLLRPQLIVEN